MSGGSVVIGIGNAYRSDDAAGLAVAARVRARAPDEVSVLEAEQEPTRLLDAWSGAHRAVVIDAVSSGAEPGTLHRFDASGGQLPEGLFRSSTHAFGVGEAVELARALGRLPERVVVYGIEGASFVAGEGLTPAVAAAVESVAESVLHELREASCTSAR
jgi:hydrogenase maturation protease